MLTVEQRRAARADRRRAAQQEAIAMHRRRLARLDELAAIQARAEAERRTLAPTSVGHNPAAVRALTYEQWLKSPYYLDAIEAMAALTPDPPAVIAARVRALKEAS